MAQSSSIAGTGRTLVDAQINGLDSDVTMTSPLSGTTAVTSGTNGSVQLTKDSLTSAQVLATQRWNATLIVIRKGILKAGVTAPDLQVSLLVDGSQNYTADLLLDASEESNMAPSNENVEDGIVWLLGESLIMAAALAKKTGRPGGNFPLRFTGVPAQESIQVLFTSHAGFASSDFLVPPTVQVIGDVFDQGALDYVNQWLGTWDPTTKMVEGQLRYGSAVLRATSPRRELLGYAPLEAPFNLPGGKITMQNFIALPTGSQQVSATKVSRFARFCRPKADITAKTITALANDPNVGGAQGNVEDQQSLGMRYAGTANARIIESIGRRPRPNHPSPSLSYGAGWFGITFDQGKTVYPSDGQYGIVCTPTRNPVPFGIKPDNQTYYRRRRYGGWAPGEAASELVYNENAAVTLTGSGTISGTGTADTDSVNRNLVDETSVIGINIVAGGPVNS